jgi:hypothetical protein
MEALTQQNAKLLLRILEQSHPEVNRGEHEEEIMLEVLQTSTKKSLQTDMEYEVAFY